MSREDRVGCSSGKVEVEAGACTACRLHVGRMRLVPKCPVQVPAALLVGSSAAAQHPEGLQVPASARSRNSAVGVTAT